MAHSKLVLSDWSSTHFQVYQMWLLLRTTEAPENGERWTSKQRLTYDWYYPGTGMWSPSHLQGLFPQTAPMLPTTGYAKAVAPVHPLYLGSFTLQRYEPFKSIIWVPKVVLCFTPTFTITFTTVRSGLPTCLVNYLHSHHKNYHQLYLYTFTIFSYNSPNMLHPH